MRRYKNLRSTMTDICNNTNRSPSEAPVVGGPSALSDVDKEEILSDPFLLVMHIKHSGDDAHSLLELLKERDRRMIKEAIQEYKEIQKI